MKQMQSEQAQEEYARHLKELRAEIDFAKSEGSYFPGEDWDAEVYEAWKQAMERLGVLGVWD